MTLDGSHITASGHCIACGHHEDWGCDFRCPIHMPPRRQRDYRMWADIQKQGYSREHPERVPIQVFMEERRGGMLVRYRAPGTG